MTTTIADARKMRCHRESRLDARRLLLAMAEAHYRQPNDADRAVVDGLTLCQADACMAWRWHLSPKRIVVAKALVDARTPVSDAEASIARAAPQGYCGIAGAQGLD